MALANHDFREEVNDSVRRLVGVSLREDVARISSDAARLPRNEPEHPTPHVIMLPVFTTRRRVIILEW